MQDSNTQTPSQSDLDEIAGVEALLSGEPEKAPEPVAQEAANPEAAAPEKEEGDGNAPEKEQIDYELLVPITGGEPVKLGELKDAWQNQQSTKLELIERENAVVREREQANLLLSYIDQLPPHVVEAAKERAVVDFQRELAILHEAIPEARTPEGAKAMKESIYRLADEYGVPKQAIDQIKNAVTVKMMYDFARLKDSIKAAKANVKPLRSESANGRPGVPASSKSDIQGKIDRAKQTRNSADETAAVDALLRSA